MQDRLVLGVERKVEVPAVEREQIVSLGCHDVQRGEVNMCICKSMAPIIAACELLASRSLRLLLMTQGARAAGSTATLAGRSEFPVTSDRVG